MMEGAIKCVPLGSAALTVALDHHIGKFGCRSGQMFHHTVSTYTTAVTIMPYKNDGADLLAITLGNFEATSPPCDPLKYYAYHIMSCRTQCATIYIFSTLT